MVSSQGSSQFMSLFEKYFEKFSHLFYFFTAPVIFLFAILVKFTSKGPAFFKQERVVTWSILFQYKLRSMVLNAEELKMIYLI